MPKVLVPWPKSPIDEIVQAFLGKHEISADDVASYSIERGADGATWLTLKIWYDEKKKV